MHVDFIYTYVKKYVHTKPASIDMLRDAFFFSFPLVCHHQILAC